MGVLIFMVQRTLAMIPLLIGISIVAFALILAVPGDFVDAWVSQVSAQTGQSREALAPQAALMRARLGLDKPAHIQYWIWIKNIVLSGDFGESFVHSRPVIDLVGLRFWRTLVLAIVTLVVGQVIGVLLGIYAAKNQYTLGDNLATLFAFTGIMVPKFIVSLILLYFLAFVWHSPYIGSFYSPEFLLQERYILAKAWDWFLHVWPVLAISIWAGQAYTLRVMRGNLLDVMNAQYIETAKAKGLSSNRTLWKHAVPNALHPIIMNMGGRFDYMIKGEIEVAIVLGLPTIGPLILSSVAGRDMYVMSAIFLIVAFAIVIGNLFADFLLALLDPRVRQVSMAGSS